MSRNSYSWKSFSAMTEDSIASDGNLSVGDSFVYEGANIEMWVYDNDHGLGGDRHANERGSDWQPGWVLEDGQWTNIGNSYWEGYFVARGSDGRTYYVIEVEGSGDCDDYFTFYGAVPPKGTTLTMACYYNDCGSLHYSCLGAGSVVTDATPDAIADFLGFTVGDSNTDSIGNILSNDDAGNSQALIVKSIDGSAALVGVWIDLAEGGRVMVAANGTVTFDDEGEFAALGEGETATINISYTVENSDGNTDTASVTLTVTGVDDAPVANDQAVRTDEDTAVTGNVLDSAFDADGDAIELASVSFNGQVIQFGVATTITTVDGYTGTLVVEADGSFTYTPGADAQAMNEGDVDTFDFTYSIVAGTEEVEMTREVVKTREVEKTREVTTERDVTKVMDFDGGGSGKQNNGFGNGDQDAPGNSEYNNNAENAGGNGNGTSSPTFKRGDVVTNQYDGVTVWVDAFGKGGRYDEAMIFDSNKPTGGDKDLKTKNQNNILIISEDGDSRDPDDNASGGKVFFKFDEPADVSSITLIDNEEGVWIGFFDESWNQTGSKWVNGGKNKSIMDVDFGNQGNNATYMLVHMCGSGALDDIVYTTTETVTVTETYTVIEEYTVTETYFETVNTFDDGVVTVTIDGLNDGEPPLVTAISRTVTEDDAAFSVDLLEGASDPEGTTLSINNVNGGDALGAAITGSTLTVDPNAYDALAAGEEATFVVSYDVTDADGMSTANTATITVTGVNDGPTANADSASTDEETPTVTLNVLDNDTDPDSSDTLSVATASIVAGATVALVSSAGNAYTGTLDIAADGTVSLTVADAQTLAVGETITYEQDITITDGNGGESTAGITLTVNGLNDDPTTGAALVANVDDNTDPFTMDLLEGAGDVDNGAVLNISVTSATGGTPDASTNTGIAGVTLNGNSLEVDPTAYDGFLDGTDSATITIEYLIEDGLGGVVAQTATINIAGANDLEGVDDAFTVGQKTTGVDGTVIGAVLGNDYDPDGGTLSVTGFAGAAIGETVRLQIPDPVGGFYEADVTMQSDGTFVFEQVTTVGIAEGETEDFTFEYTVVDGQGGTSTATVTVSVDGTNEDPVALNDINFRTNEDNQISGNVLANDTDGDFTDVLNVGTGRLLPVISDLGTGRTGEVVIQPDGSFTFIPGPSFQDMNDGDVDQISFTYTARDGNGGVDTATATIIIDGITDQTGEVTEDIINLIFVLDNSVSAFADLGFDPIFGTVDPFGNGDGVNNYVDWAINYTRTLSQSVGTRQLEVNLDFVEIADTDAAGNTIDVTNLTPEERGGTIVRSTVFGFGETVQNFGTFEALDSDLGLALSSMDNALGTTSDYGAALAEVKAFLDTTPNARQTKIYFVTDGADSVNSSSEFQSIARQLDDEMGEYGVNIEAVGLGFSIDQGDLAFVDTPDPSDSTDTVNLFVDTFSLANAERLEFTFEDTASPTIFDENGVLLPEYLV